MLAVSLLAALLPTGIGRAAAPSDFVWGRAFGGVRPDEARAVTVDATGNIYIAGSFRGTVDFDLGPGTTNRSSFHSDSDDAFVSKLNTNGNLEWVRTFGGRWGEKAQSVAVDLAGNVYITGSFTTVHPSSGWTVDLDPGPGEVLVNGNGSQDVFLSKFDADGNLLWARTFGGTEWDEGTAVAVDTDNNVFVAGHFRGTVDFDPGGGTESRTSNGNEDAFLSKFDGNGNLVWVGTYGGAGYDAPTGIAVDTVGNVHTTGSFTGTVDFDPGPGVANRTSSASAAVFVSKMDATGGLVWVHVLGGRYGQAIAVDGTANIFVTGIFMGLADFDPGPGAEHRTSNGHWDVFVVVLDPAGDLRWARTFGSASSILGDDVRGVAVDTAGSVFITGYFLETVDFDPGPGAAHRTSNGLGDAYVVRFDSDGILTWLQTFGGTGWEHPQGVAVDATGKVIVAGYFDGTTDLDPGPGTANRTSTGEGDVFVVKLDTLDSDNDGFPDLIDNFPFLSSRCRNSQATIVGTEGHDIIHGTEGPDVIMGFGGHDTIYGYGGNDLICAGPGNDVVYGGDGRDKIYGDDGDDALYGEKGSDWLYGGKGDDNLQGGKGTRDRLFGGPGTNLLNGGQGTNDQCTLGPTFKNCEVIL